MVHVGPMVERRPFPPDRAEQLTADNFGFGHEIRRALRNWLDDWTDNFADAPFEHPHTWKKGFDVDAWIEEGDRISRLIETSLPDFNVERNYRTYANSAVREEG